MTNLLSERGTSAPLDLDIKSFFDKVEHDHMEKFVRHRIGDERVVRLILKWMKAGVMLAKQASTGGPETDGGRTVVRDGGRDPARFGDFTAPV